MEVRDDIDDDGLRPIHHTAIAQLLSQKTIKAAAVAAGVAETTLHCWLKDRNFCRVYRRARQRAFDVAVNTLTRITPAAVKALQRNLTCGNPMAEVRAAIAILDKVIAAGAVADLQTEVEELRAKLEEQHAADARERDKRNPLAEIADGKELASTIGTASASSRLSGEPGDRVPGVGHDAGSVAGSVPPRPSQASSDPRDPARWENGCFSDEDIKPLFE